MLALFPRKEKVFEFSHPPLLPPPPLPHPHPPPLPLRRRRRPRHLLRLPLPLPEKKYKGRRIIRYRIVGTVDLVTGGTYSTLPSNGPESDNNRALHS